MQRLSLPIGRLQAHYDVVIVGSGYGGAVAASRLARASDRWGHKPTVCVLERGNEWQPGSYPDRLRDAVPQMQLDSLRGHVGSPTGLYDFRYNKDLSVLVGCGLGGTSLINANVVVRPTPAVLSDERWPVAIRDDAKLECGYTRALDMLKPEAYPRPNGGSGSTPHPGATSFVWPALNKRDTLQATAKALAPLPYGYPAHPTFISAELAVSFATRVNHVGVQEKACNLCGNCVSGCNFAAKKTLIMNYLPDARNNGAQIFCGVAVRWLEHWPSAKGRHWVVHFELPNAERERFRPPEMFVTADRVILAAGSLGSTEILLRSRERGLRLSRQLGFGFSGNADFAAFGYNLERPVRAVGSRSDQPPTEESVGPTITGIIDARTKDGRGGILIQEGAIPAPLSAPLRLLFPIAARTVATMPEWSPREHLKKWGRELLSLITGARLGALRNTQTLLVMGHDETTGQLALVRDRVRVQWPGVGSQKIFQDVKRLLYQATTRLGGVLVENPLWSRALGRKLFTVHPLGGCVMAETPDKGVVNDKGEVFNGARDAAVHRGLYVCDGAVIPVSLGANPLLTICAVAERTAGLIADEVRQGNGENGKPENSGVRSTVPNARAPARNGDNPAPAVGIRFSERMIGAYSWDGDSTKRFPIEMVVTAISENLAALLQDRDHTMELVGVVRAPELSGNNRPLTITNASFNLFAPIPARVEQWRMGYHMTLTSVDRRSFEVSGDKPLHGDAWIGDAWKDLTRLPIVVHEYRDSKPVRTAHGSVRIPHWDLWRVITSGRVTGARTRLQQFRTRLRFIRFYAGRLLHVYGWPIGSVDVIDPEVVPKTRAPIMKRMGERPASAPPLPEPIRRDIATEDDAQIRLTRYVDPQRTRDRGAVILAPGFGMSTYGYVLPTIEPNLTEYLVGRGYDVWLLDYRASELTPSSRTQFTIDDIAKYDFPTAVEYVTAVRREESEKNPRGDSARLNSSTLAPHFLGHCVASAALLMAVLRGYLAPPQADGAAASHNGTRPPPRVRSIICSQFFTHFVQPPINQLKANLRLADILLMLRAWPTLTSDFDKRSPLGAWIWDRILHFYPSHERCRNPVCRRNLFLYGEVVRHDRLNTDTHNAMYDMFNRANLTTMKHLQRMVHAGHIVDARGNNTYLIDAKVNPEIRDRLRLPITLLQGMKNRLFHPIGGERAITWLRDNGYQPRKDELYRMERIADYGHLDLFIGRDAATDVFPLISRALDNGARLAETLAP